MLTANQKKVPVNLALGLALTIAAIAGTATPSKAGAVDNGLTQMTTDLSSIGTLGSSAVQIGGAILSFVIAATVVHKVAMK